MKNQPTPEAIPQPGLTNGSMAILSRAALRADYVRVLESQQPDIAEKILTYEATADEAHTWYASRDPIAEGFLRKSEKMSDEDSQHWHIFGAAQVNAAFAGVMLADIVGYDLKHASANASTTLMENESPYFRGIDSLFMSNRLLKVLSPKLLPEKVLERPVDVLMVLDGLATSGSKLNQAVDLFADIASAAQEIEPEFAASMQQDVINLDGIAEQMYRRVQGLREPLGSLLDSDDYERKKTGLKSTQFFAALDYTTSVTDEEYKSKGAEYRRSVAAASVGQIIDAVEKCFLNPEDAAPVIKGSKKGDLHEAMYLADMLFLLSSDLKYNNTQINPALPRLDAPKVGYPVHRRGYDFLIGTVDEEYNLNMIPIQLKSRKEPQDRGAAYHPNIKKIEEVNFRDANKRSLAAKIAMYRRWVDSGMSQDATRQVERNVLGSAWETMQLIDNSDYSISL